MSSIMSQLLCKASTRQSPQSYRDRVRPCAARALSIDVRFVIALTVE
jgi:hypothetical protein